MAIAEIRRPVASWFVLLLCAVFGPAAFAADRGGDCNDLNPAVYPGHAEVAGNRYDDDCDGLADEDLDNNTSPDGGDFDGDSQSLASGDCDDTNPSARPDAAEVPGNLVDDDCDGLADEDANDVPSTDDTDTDGDGFSVLDRVFRSGFEAVAF